MESQLVLGYILYVNGESVSVGRTLEGVQKDAKHYLNSNELLRIESSVGPAPTRIWNYDSKIQKWVELVRV